MYPCVAVAMFSVLLVYQTWFVYRAEEIFAVGSGVTLRDYVAPSWHRLAARVRSGELTLTRDQQAARFERIAGFFESQARYERNQQKRA